MVPSMMLRHTTIQHITYDNQLKLPLTRVATTSSSSSSSRSSSITSKRIYQNAVTNSAMITSILLYYIINISSPLILIDAFQLTSPYQSRMKQRCQQLGILQHLQITPINDYDPDNDNSPNEPLLLNNNSLLLSTTTAAISTSTVAVEISKTNMTETSGIIEISTEVTSTYLDELQQLEQQHVDNDGVILSVEGTLATTDPTFEIWIASIALIAGTTIGAGILALPTVTYTSGFIVSSISLFFGYIVMTLSGLYIAELTIRISSSILLSSTTTTTGLESDLNELKQPQQIEQVPKPTTTTLGLLDVYNQGLMSNLSDSISSTTTQIHNKNTIIQYSAIIAYFFLHYAMMVAYIAQGGNNLINVFPIPPTIPVSINGPIVFTSIMATSMYCLPKRIISIINNIFVIGVFISMGGILLFGANTVDINALFNIQYQHPMYIISTLPIIFLAFVYHNIVPFIVKELQYNIPSIQSAIIAGTTLPFGMFVLWNAIILGNIDPITIASNTNFDPVSILMNNGSSSSSSSVLLGPLITIFSTLAVITSLIGFTYGLNEAWNDLFNMVQSTDSNTNADENSSISETNVSGNTISSLPMDSWTSNRLFVFALIFIPPLLIALYNPNIFVSALEYGGTFGVTILFLLLPSYLLWNQRYKENKSMSYTTNDTNEPILVPGGKIPIICLWITAVGLIIEQIIEKFVVGGISI
jgi:tyrosine-specific transport protein